MLDSFFALMGVQNLVFLPLIWMIRIFSIEGNEFIFFHFHKDNVSYHTKRHNSGLHKKLEKFSSLLLNSLKVTQIHPKIDAQDSKCMQPIETISHPNTREKATYLLNRIL